MLLNSSKMINFQVYRYCWNLTVRNRCTSNIINSFARCTPSHCYVHHAGGTRDPTVVVYEGPLRKRMMVAKLISLSSSMLAFAMMPKVLLDLSNTSLLLAAGFGLISTAFLSTPLLLHWITKRYILTLRYDPLTRKFHATTFNLVCMETEQTFTAADVSVPDLPGMLSSFHVKGAPLFVDAGMVRDPDAYSHMMGYDQPLDLMLKKKQEETR